MRFFLPLLLLLPVSVFGETGIIAVYTPPRHFDGFYKVLITLGLDGHLMVYKNVDFLIKTDDPEKVSREIAREARLGKVIFNAGIGIAEDGDFDTALIKAMVAMDDSRKLGVDFTIKASCLDLLVERLKNYPKY